MRRVTFVEEKVLRPEIPYREYIVHDAVLQYTTLEGASSCLLTIYKKGDTVLGIAHESGQRSQLNIGEGAKYFWPDLKSRYDKNMICVQGYDGHYQYVSLGAEIENHGTNVRLNYGRPGNARVVWYPAGTLQQVLERHLK